MDSKSQIRPFHAKILLFGEHLINLGCDALSVPYPSFSGKLQQSEKLDPRIEKYLAFLKEQEFDFLDQEKLSQRSDFVFVSDIPEGYGCGSSGAIVAASYDHFKSKNESNKQNLKNHFSNMESYFHGVSSGTDPMISYLNKPIRFTSSGDIIVLQELEFVLDEYTLILIDSGNPREGKVFINWFMDKANDNSFRDQLNKVLIPHTQVCIQSLSGDRSHDFLSSFRSISHFQFHLMQKMIPEHMKTLWASGLDSQKFFLKICGAGGGGFFIGLVKKDDLQKLMGQFNTYSLV